MEDKRNDVWLSQCFPYGSPLPGRLLAQYGSAKAVYEAEEQDLASCGILTEKEAKIVKRTSLERADRILNDCAHHKIRVLTQNDPDYPERLRNLFAPPTVLYVLGAFSGIDEEPVVTVIGTRSASEYSLAVARQLSADLAKAGCTIVSGCAVGIDAQAHRAAIEAGGKTIAVLACGLNVNYPAENGKLKRAILNSGGALISEYPPGVNVTRQTFPVRNRLMAALAVGVLIVQAPVRSGTLLTAEHALEQGKELYCVPPCDLFDPNYNGVIRYLRDGAVPVFAAEDIALPLYAVFSEKLDLSELKGDYGYAGIVSMKGLSKHSPGSKWNKRDENETVFQEKTHLKSEKKQETVETTFDEIHKMVYNHLNTHPKTIDELAVLCQLDVGTLYSVLTDLELSGAISSPVGGRYVGGEEVK